MVYCILYCYSIKYNSIMNIRIFKIHKIKMFWIIVLIILGLGYLYFYKYNQPVNEGLELFNQLENQLKRETRQNMENMKTKKDSFINKSQNALMKKFL
jgi:hypothetical protein